MCYLARGEVGEPSLEVGGVQAWDEAAALEGAQLSRGMVSCGDHLVEAVLEGGAVLMSPLMLREGRHPQVAVFNHRL